jgi:hypothetical protein
MKLPLDLALRERVRVCATGRRYNNAGARARHRLYVLCELPASDGTSVRRSDGPRQTQRGARSEARVNKSASGDRGND